MADNDDDKKLPAASLKMAEDNNDDSDVELEGMDLDGLDADAPDDDDDAADDDIDNDDDAANREESPDHLEHEKEDIQHEQEDLQELEAARKERMELMAEELKREKELQEKQQQEQQQQSQQIDPNSKFQYLIGQSEVFAHFLAGASAASAGKKKKKGSRGKANRMTEAEEDAQLLATATSARRTVYLNTQPKILAEHCKMHKYQLEGLNWMIKLHDHGINGILADEVS